MSDSTDQLFDRFQELQAYVEWTQEDVRRVCGAANILQASFPKLAEDFYDEILRHPEARKVLKGGEAQIERLKESLQAWLLELVSGDYGVHYVKRRWQVGWRHVEIGLDQVFTNAALSRLRAGFCKALEESWQGSLADFAATVRSVNKLLDLDLAIIEDAYQAENLLRVREHSEETFRTLVEAARCMIVILRPDHSICYFSPGAEHITGYQAGEVLGKDYISIFLSQENRALLEASMQKVFDMVPARGFESIVVCKDGAPRHMMWNAVLLPRYEGSPALLGIGQDITAHKEAQERAMQAERLAAIGEMVAGLAHESGNALARSQACLEMLSLEIEENAEACDLIQRIQKAQDHLRQLYDDVRGYAAPLKLDREVWDVSGIWRQAWHNLEGWRQGRQIDFCDHVDGADLHCFVDSFRLEQVFRNIFENSLAACADPAAIRVDCTEATLEGKPALQIAVSDSGSGLDAKQRQRIFDPFFTTKTKGTGLGMAIARRIVEAHHGKIAVGAGASQGTQILIVLPREEL